MKKTGIILAAALFATITISLVSQSAQLSQSAQPSQHLQTKQESITQHDNIKGETKMKTIIVYSSTTGFTKQYAQWISEATGFEAVELKSAAPEQIQNADRVVFGSSLMADHIRDLDKIQKMNIKNLLLFAVGLTEKNDEYTKKIAEINQTTGTPLFYMRGGAHLKKLNFFARVILKKVSGLKEDVDYSDKSYINELVEFLNK